MLNATTTMYSESYGMWEQQIVSWHLNRENSGRENFLCLFIFCTLLFIGLLF